MNGIGMGPDGPVGLVLGQPAKKVIFCVPVLNELHPAFIDALESAVPLLNQEGWDHGIVFEINCPYISAARATMLRKALDVKADIIVFLDQDVSFDPSDLCKLIATKGDVISGTYRFKQNPEEYMGLLLDGPDRKPVVRDDGCVAAELVPGGFLKITKEGVDKFLKAYPNLAYGASYAPHIDLFNHGADSGRWWGEDYAFSRRWRACGGELWIVPDLNINHHHKDKVWKGNFHKFLLKQPGGSNHVHVSYDCEVKYGATDRMRNVEGKKDRSSRKTRLGKTGNSGHKPRPQPGRVARSKRHSPAVRG